MLRLILMTMLLITACVACTDNNKKQPAERGDTTEPRPTLQNSSSPRLSHAPAKRSRAHFSQSDAAETTNVAPKSADRTAAGQLRAAGFISLPTGAPAAGADVVLWTSSDDKNSSIPWHRASETKSNPDGSYKIHAPVNDS